MEPMDTILEQDIPEAQQNLRDSNVNLEKVAQYCKANYVQMFGILLQSDNKKKAFDETKDYAIQALASVAYQINVFSYNLSQLFDAQDVNISEMETEVNHVDQTIKIHKEKIARRDIGALATTNKPNQRQNKILPPPTPERVIRYTRRNIDYSIYDDIGHGLKLSHQNHQPRHGRKGPSSVDGGSISSSGSQSQTYGTNDLYRKTGPVSNITGTLSRKQASNMGDYRTPQIAPVQPPLPPPGVFSNGHYGPGNAGNQKPSYNSPHMQQRVNEHYHPSSISNYSTGSASPPIYQSQNQYGPGAGQTMPSQYSGQRTAFPYPPQIPTAQVSRKSSSASGGYGSLPISNMSLNGDSHQRYQSQQGPPSTAQQVMNNAQPANNHSVNNYHGGMSAYGANSSAEIYGKSNGRIPGPDPSQSQQRYSQNPVTVTAAPPPPPPPPPPGPGFNGNPASLAAAVNRNGSGPLVNPAKPQIPSGYIEKVVAIYDYQADKEDELSFSENQIIYVMKKNDDGWYEGVMDGMRGLFPGNYVEPSAR